MRAFDPAVSEEASQPPQSAGVLPHLPCHLATHPPGLGRVRGRAALSPWGLISKKVTKALALPWLQRD